MLLQQQTSRSHHPGRRLDGRNPGGMQSCCQCYVNTGIPPRVENIGMAYGYRVGGVCAVGDVHDMIPATSIWRNEHYLRARLMNQAKG